MTATTVSEGGGGASGGDTSPPPAPPEIFRLAVESLTNTAVRSEVRVEPLRPPQRLAPYSYAVSAEIIDGEGKDLATGRLVLLHDPDGHEAWDGVLRLVAYASAELDDEMGVDPMLPAVGWSWLTDSLDERAAAYRAAGGTVTQTTSTRFGDLHGPRTAVSIELRASWTVDTADLSPHLLAFVDLLCTAAGLPPEGVTALSSS
ncbi:MAG: DUF3000 domain-containing protein [Jatrophihabitans sp.]|uniref:DUF3000 domain-containing protein n=1 Tax=Jatrophihabitans sp. TaxID=1932789 RepID=UPI0039169F33